MYKRQLQEAYYPAENMKWISRHLTGEAAIWWRIVRSQINTFQEFAEIFVEKYWGATQQERIHDQLEYGRYNPHGTLSTIQYMERFGLQCRQLIPIMLDRHLIKKLARHYNRETQVAVVTRGITMINNFEILLQEYMNVTSRRNNDAQKAEERLPRKGNEHSNFPKQKQWNNEQRQGWCKDYVTKPKAESGLPVIFISS